MSILTEKDPSFIQDTRIEGNLSVVEHPNDASYYGDGSVEIGGTLSVDTMKSATPNSVMVVKSPFVLNNLANEPVAPPSGTTMVYSASAFGGRIVMVDSTGTRIDLNPLKSVGDIMTFDGVKNTTTRVPTGLPSQTLTCDPIGNFATRLSWKDDEANVYSIDGASDGYMRYCEAYNTNGLPLLNAPQLLITDHAARADSDTFSVASGGAGGILVLQSGTYEVVVNARVSFSEEKVRTTTLENGSIVPVEMYLDSGFVIVPASRNMHNITYYDGGSQTISCRMVLNFATNTRLRVFLQEGEGSNSGVLLVKPNDALVSITKLAWKSDQSRLLSVQGLQGSRPPLVSDFTQIPLTTIIYKGNEQDVIEETGITMASTGYRHIVAKCAFEKYNVNTDLKAVVECRVLVNGTEILDGSSRTTLVGSIGNASVTVNAVTQMNSGDVITLEARILSGNLESGGIMIMSEQCYLTTYLPNVDSWKRVYNHSDSVFTASPGEWTGINYPVVVDYSGSEFSGTQEFVTLSGGTISYLYKMDLENVDSVVCNLLTRLVVDTGNGYKMIPGSMVGTILSPGSIETVFAGATVYLPPHSKVRCEILAPNGGNVNVRDDLSSFFLNKYENTKSAFTGSTDFGRFYRYVDDDDEVISTSTSFSTRLSAYTVNLPAGDYRFGMSFEWDMNVAGIGFETQVTLDGDVIDTYDTVPLITGVYSKVTSFTLIHLDSGEHTFKFNTKINDSTRSLYTRNVRMEFWKTL